MDLDIVYFAGETLEYIRRAPSFGVAVKGEGLLIDNLTNLLEYLEILRLSSTTRVKIKELIERFGKLYNEEEELKEKDKIKLLDDVKLWSDRIQNELTKRVVIEAFTEGTLNYKKTLSGGEGFFPERIWDGLSPISKSDLNDACKCLLTQSWTPAVMISLRASEDCIRGFYKTKTGEKPPIGWRKILDELDKPGVINKTLIGYLHYIREMRNEAEHPDRVFDQLEAERVFHQVVNMIILIDREISLFKKASKEKKK